MQGFTMAAQIRPQTSFVLLTLLMACAPWPACRLSGYGL